LALLLSRPHTTANRYLERDMKRLLRRFSRWFHSFDETDDDIARLIRTAEDGARLGMVGWY
jgi:hypothetical protein